MVKQVLYLGDTHLAGSAAYLAGILDYHGIGFDHVASDRELDSAQLDNDYDVVILSDYPSRNFSTAQLLEVSARVENGTGLVMIGGWESYVGRGGDYQGTRLRDVLPVEMLGTDDRRNYWGPCIVVKERDHPIVSELDFEQRLPCVCGYNEVRPRIGATVVLSVRRFAASRGADGQIGFTPERTDPLLVVGARGQGNVACFTSDVAPHWTGGLVDWGGARIAAKAPGASLVEIGDAYARLFFNIVKWAGKIGSSPDQVLR